MDTDEKIMILTSKLQHSSNLTHSVIESWIPESYNPTISVSASQPSLYLKSDAKKLAILKSKIVSKKMKEDTEEVESGRKQVGAKKNGKRSRPESAGLDKYLKKMK